MLIYAAADVKYFINHGLEFINSAVEHDNRCFVLVFPNYEQPPHEQEGELRDFLNEKFHKNKHPNVEKLCMKPVFFPGFLDVDIVDMKAYYASFRFLALPKLLQETDEDVLVLDIDSVINRKLPDIEEDVGIYLRENNTIGANEYEVNGMKVAAGALYVKRKAFDFANDIAQNIKDNPVRWFNDQHAIYKSYKKYRNDFTYFDFANTNWLDWTFVNPDAYVITGKGNRKDSPVYLDIKKQYEQGNPNETIITNGDSNL